MHKFELMNKRFNIRVYGLLIDDGKLLVSEEPFRGQLITKLPGGGLEWGEGSIDCLKREWKEELDLDIEILAHFYTTDYFIKSWLDDSQLISIYYLVKAPVTESIKNMVPGERTYWMDIADVNNETFTLPADKVVAGILNKMHGNN